MPTRMKIMSGEVPLLSFAVIAAIIINLHAASVFVSTAGHRQVNSRGQPAGYFVNLKEDKRTTSPPGVTSATWIRFGSRAMPPQQPAHHAIVTARQQETAKAPVTIMDPVGSTNSEDQQATAAPGKNGVTWSRFGSRDMPPQPPTANVGARQQSAVGHPAPVAIDPAVGGSVSEDQPTFIAAPAPHDVWGIRLGSKGMPPHQRRVVITARPRAIMTQAPVMLTAPAVVGGPAAKEQQATAPATNDVWSRSYDSEGMPLQDPTAIRASQQEMAHPAPESSEYDTVTRVITGDMLLKEPQQEKPFNNHWDIMEEKLEDEIRGRVSRVFQKIFSEEEIKRMAAGRLLNAVNTSPSTPAPMPTIQIAQHVMSDTPGITPISSGGSTSGGAISSGPISVSGALMAGPASGAPPISGGGSMSGSTGGSMSGGTADSTSGSAGSPMSGSGTDPLSGSAAGPMSGSGTDPLSGSAGSPMSGSGTDPLSGSAAGPMSGSAGSPMSGSGTDPLSGSAAGSMSGSGINQLSGGAAGLMSGSATGSMSGSGTDPLSGSGAGSMSGSGTDPFSGISTADPLSGSAAGSMSGSGTDPFSGSDAGSMSSSAAESQSGNAAGSMMSGSGALMGGPPKVTTPASGGSMTGITGGNTPASSGPMSGSAAGGNTPASSGPMSGSAAGSNTPASSGPMSGSAAGGPTPASGESMSGSAGGSMSGGATGGPTPASGESMHGDAGGPTPASGSSMSGSPAGGPKPASGGSIAGNDGGPKPASSGGSIPDNDGGPKPASGGSMADTTDSSEGAPVTTPEKPSTRTSVEDDSSSMESSSNADDDDDDDDDDDESCPDEDPALDAGTVRPTTDEFSGGKKKVAGCKDDMCEAARAKYGSKKC